ncbi:MAG: helix-turn-helix domain-containing protein [Chloroflexi bacterium]|nr:helix-turn-helix domain-containing protein [Chloroflexota bacterium]
MNQEALISISEASHILGVSEAALRQWTDEGKIKAFVTPGGHRRYSRVELKKFMGSNQKMLGIKDLVGELEDTVGAHREIARSYLSTTSWYNQLSRESQEYLGELGRRLLSLIIRYITESSRREEIMEQARGVGQSHGEALAKLGLPLTDAVGAFIMHRNPIIDATTHMMKKREGLNGRVVEAIPMVDHVMDEALVALVAAHQRMARTEGDTA